MKQRWPLGSGPLATGLWHIFHSGEERLLLERCEKASLGGGGGTLASQAHGEYPWEERTAPGWLRPCFLPLHLPACSSFCFWQTPLTLEHVVKRQFLSWLSVSRQGLFHSSCGEMGPVTNNDSETCDPCRHWERLMVKEVNWEPLAMGRPSGHDSRAYGVLRSLWGWGWGWGVPLAQTEELPEASAHPPPKARLGWKVLLSHNPITR